MSPLSQRRRRVYHEERLTSHGTDGENILLDAIQALQNEGTRGDVAQNFREQGNEAAKEKRWADAKEFYTKAIAVLLAKEDKWDKPEDQKEEDKLRRQVEEAAYINRALCNLELSMLSPRCGLESWLTRLKKTTALRRSTALRP